jgi:PAS domain S-box-containing protein
MRMPAELQYHRLYVVVSVFVAVGASIAALWLAFRTADVWQRLVAAVIMGVAISGMHYTGMTAAEFTAHAHGEIHGTANLAQTSMGIAIGGITFLILVLALIASTVDSQFAVLAERETVLLRESEEQFRELYRQTPLPLHSLGPDGRMENASDTWLQLLGYRREDAIGRDLTEFMTAETKRDYEQNALPLLWRGGEIREAEYSFVKKSGEVLDVLWSARVDTPHGRPRRILGGLIDLTARKRAEAALRQSQRMEAIGQLTGGVAHDFNNLLMVISGAADRLKRTSTDPATARPLEMIGMAVKRGENLTGHLLSFARRRTLEATVIDLAKLLPTVSEMLKRSLRGDIDIRTRMGDGACRVQVDQGELELALLNIGVNARDAMPEGGVLAVSVQPVRLYGEEETDRLRGDFVLIELTDTGAGIRPELLQRVFEPFFTTKGPGKGTGLGLSQVYGFTKQSGGTATVTSRLGHGTVLRLYLPAVDLPLHDGQDAAPAVPEATTRKGTALVVEDNPQVATVSAEYLEQLGYTIEYASSGSDALQKLREERQYDLVFSDILMPGSIGGIELARIMRNYHAGIPILLTTGYNEKTQEAVSEGFAIVQKPFDLQGLSKVLRELPPKPADGNGAGAASGRM